MRRHLPLFTRHHSRRARNVLNTRRAFAQQREQKEGVMLYTLAVILLIAWLLGIVGTYTIGAFVHVLLVVALVLLLVGVISGRRTVI
jgi:hypothetical protein